MKRFAVLSTLILLLSAAVGAQVISNPNDIIYQDLDRWDRQGLIKVPGLKPAPAEIVIRLLKAVVQSGPKDEADLAEHYLSEIDRDFNVNLSASQTNRASKDSLYSQSNIDIFASGFIAPNLHVDSVTNLMMVDRTEGLVLPSGQRMSQDYTIDQTDFSVKGRTLLATPGLTNNMNYSVGNLYLQAGLVRNSFGPELADNIILTPEARQSGAFSFYWAGETLAYTQLFKTLLATPDDGSALRDNGKTDQFPDKYFQFHSLEWTPVDWFRLTYFETLVYGERIEPLYFLPFQEYLYSSIYSGNSDNVLLGGSLEFWLPQNLKLNMTAYADDLHLIDMVLGDFDTKFKLAGQGSLSWNPLKGILSEIKGGYSLVLPYMFTHRQESNILEHPENVNYLNYTHLGEPLVVLQPNSDRISLSVKVNPLENLSVTLWGTYSRHGNASEDVSFYWMENPDYDEVMDSNGDGILTAQEQADATRYGLTDPASFTVVDRWIPDPDRLADGSIMDSGYDYKDKDHLFDTTNFLGQDLLEATLQLGIEARYSAPFGLTRFYGNLSYTYENILNKALVKGQDETNHYVSVQVGYNF